MAGLKIGLALDFWPCFLVLRHFPGAGFRGRRSKGLAVRMMVRNWIEGGIRLVALCRQRWGRPGHRISFLFDRCAIKG
jgi:hypothetical protein